MAADPGAPGGTTKREGFAIFAATCAVVALVFAVANFFVASNARDTAESAKTVAERALAGTETVTEPTTAPTTAPASPRTAVGVTLDEYSIALNPNPPSAGNLSFNILNRGKIAHEFVVFRTDLAADALRVKKNGDVNEDSPQLQTVADSGSDLKAGASRSVRATLTPGHYVAVCNLPGHYAAGMRVDITVA